jgi:hypothetical protein
MSASYESASRKAEPVGFRYRRFCRDAERVRMKETRIDLLMRAKALGNFPGFTFS